LENILQSSIPSSGVHIHLNSAMIFIDWNKIYNNNSIFSCASCDSYAFRYLPTYKTFVGYTIHFSFSSKVTCTFDAYKKPWRNYQRIKRFLTQKTQFLFHQIKVSRVLNWSCQRLLISKVIGSCHLCMEGQLKWRLQPL